MLAIKLILRATLICKLGNTFYLGLRKGVQGTEVEGEDLYQEQRGGPSLKVSPAVTWFEFCIGLGVEDGPTCLPPDLLSGTQESPFLHLFSKCLRRAFAESFCSLLGILHALVSV